ncbi:YceD family protein [Corynebacterium silvaticum]|uniref:YceD family protein n=1 Tax=Corynebacterium silvaticum TaxID=2320431 RepID=A0A7U5HMD8_9CORY|nr:YceD family protein [Corynebacterium silvaticum]ARU46413.2 YceD family protein [Corynebacterium silvaticum]MBH5299554.1 DUF177 domain-containing protein [Corynebacterium silvaticum]NOM64127.1 DUF177 domain-containing protein [Corynebacterium silvaticum]NON69332.1 DUF177 domain-containing protein [Corynebacterium silvaticum]UWG99638.1 YceD family protein [Corynebacterium silvaticum]
MMNDSSPFIFNVSSLLRGYAMPETFTQTGPSPVRIGPAMIGIPEGGSVQVDVTLIPLGDAVIAEATIRAELEGECARCLKLLTPDAEFHVSEVFAATDDFIQGEDNEGEDDVSKIIDDSIDLLQVVIDEAGMNLPFNPVCEAGCDDSESDVPAPDGVSGEKQDRTDPRWAGLEKFL